MNSLQDDSQKALPSKTLEILNTIPKQIHIAPALIIWPVDTYDHKD